VTARRFTDQDNTADVYTRDCADPESIPTRRVMVTGQRVDLAATGQLDRNLLPVLQTARSVTKNYRYVLNEPAGDIVNGGYYQGPAKLTSVVITGDDGAMVGVDLTILSDGEWSWIDVP
jgi:hypothetical protein